MNIVYEIQGYAETLGTAMSRIRDGLRFKYGKEEAKNAIEILNDLADKIENGMQYENGSGFYTPSSGTTEKGSSILEYYMDRIGKSGDAQMYIKYVDKLSGKTIFFENYILEYNDEAYYCYVSDMPWGEISGSEEFDALFAAYQATIL
jgi:hypothetical protein